MGNNKKGYTYCKTCNTYIPNNEIDFTSNREIKTEQEIDTIGGHVEAITENEYITITEICPMCKSEISSNSTFIRRIGTKYL